MELLTNYILKLENDLLKAEIRQSVVKTNELVSEDFTEFCSSGYVYQHNKGRAIDECSDLQEMECGITNFKINELSDNCVLATYRLIKYSESDENRKYSLRSSIWKCFEGKWKMIFHQGTFTKSKII